MSIKLPDVYQASFFRSTVTKFNNPEKYPPNTLTQLRTVRSYELELFLSDGETFFINGEEYPRKRGIVLLAVPGDQRQSHLHFDTIIVRFRSNDSLVTELINSVKGIYMDIDFDYTNPIFTDLCNGFITADSYSNIFLSSTLLRFLYSLKKYEPYNRTCTASKTYFSAASIATKYMEEHYMEPINIDQLAELCSLSPSHFHRVFVGTMHTTPTNYLLTLRLNHAKKFLSSTTLSITDIAFNSGFNSIAYFSYCFKKACNKTPKEFRASFAYPDTPV